METYYVVKKGRKPGIYKTWAECKAEVDSFKYAIYKKFGSFIEANEFYNAPINENRFAKSTDKIDLNGSSKVSDEDMNKIKAMVTNIKSSQFNNELNYNVNNWNIIDNEIYLFTDGSSRKSKEFFNSGVGVYLGFQCTNIKEQYNNKTNNQCELMGLDYAFKLIVRYYRELSEINKVIKIVSDSEYSIKACSVWLTAWKNNNWKTTKGDDVKNRELIESIDGSMQRIKVLNCHLPVDKKIKVKLIHVNSHQPPNMTDKTLFGIWFGNYVADGLSQNTI